MAATRRSGIRSMVQSTLFSFGMETGFGNSRLNLSRPPVGQHHAAERPARSLSANMVET